MVLNYEKLMGLDSPEQVQSYTDRETMLFALSLGIGGDPVDPLQLRYVYERQLVAVPAMAHILAMDAQWVFDPAYGIDVRRLLHVESGLAMTGELPAAGTVASKLRITETIDRGADRGAVLRFERSLADADSRAEIGVVSGSFLLRGNGGFGGPGEVRARPPAPPDRAPDAACDLPTLPQAALLYRLNLDRNPIHVDPKVAERAGFPRPILHGACTYGVAMHAFLKLVCDYDAARLAAFDLRFSAPVFPGETIRTEFWEIGASAYAFRSRAVERDIVVLDNGVARTR